MPASSGWTRQQLLVAFALYCRLPFGRLHYRNPEIVRFADGLGRTPAALAMKLTNIASLDPAITSTGRAGLRGASANDRAMWEEMQSDWERFAVESQRAVSEAMGAVEPDDEVVGDATAERIGEDRATQTTTRIGQSFFRTTVLSAYNGRCCITGLSLPTLLRAGHIIPWHVDKSNRVNPKNGLLLSVLHEMAFDAGLITINDDMTVRVSRRHAVDNDDFYTTSISRYDQQAIYLPEKFGPDRKFLVYHQENIFQG